MVRTQEAIEATFTLHAPVQDGVYRLVFVMNVTALGDADNTSREDCVVAVAGLGPPSPWR